MKLISSILFVIGVAVVLSTALYVDSAEACGGAVCGGEKQVQADAHDGGAECKDKVAVQSGCGDCESKTSLKAADGGAECKDKAALKAADGGAECKDKAAIKAADGGSCECPVHTSGESGHYKVGDKVALHVALSDCCGQEVNLNEARKNSKALVLAFYSARCPVVKAYNSRIVSLADEYRDQGATFLALNSNINETVKEIHEYKSKHSLSFPTLIDKDSRFANAFQAEVTPHIYVIDKEGVLRYRGPVDDSQDAAGIKNNFLRTAIEEVLEGKNVKQAEVDAFGCSIRRL
ncbi:redoxin domain-containing protein [candidate division KSB1 bacterium]